MKTVSHLEFVFASIHDISDDFFHFLRIAYMNRLIFKLF